MLSTCLQCSQSEGQSSGGIKDDRVDRAQVGGDDGGELPWGVWGVDFFLTKLAVEEFLLELPARIMACTSDDVAFAAAEGALLFKLCSRCSTGCTSPLSTVALYHSPPLALPIESCPEPPSSNSLTALNVDLFLLCQHPFHPTDSAVRPPLHRTPNCLPILQIDCCLYCAYVNNEMQLNVSLVVPHEQRNCLTFACSTCLTFATIPMHIDGAVAVVRPTLKIKFRRQVCAVLAEVTELTGDVLLSAISPRTSTGSRSEGPQSGGRRLHAHLP